VPRKRSDASIYRQAVIEACECTNRQPANERCNRGWIRCVATMKRYQELRQQETNPPTKGDASK
jgi:hypothetical protein